MISQFHEALPASEKGDAAVHKLTGNYLREANKRVGRKAKKLAPPPDEQLATPSDQQVVTSPNEQSCSKTKNASVSVMDFIIDESEETRKKRTRSESDGENESEEEGHSPVKKYICNVKKPTQIEDYDDDDED